MVFKSIILPDSAYIDSVRSAIESGTVADDFKDLLGQSLFYYCSGKDPTPILAFQDQFPLYVYSDIYADKHLLYETLRNNKFTLTAAHTLNLKQFDSCADCPQITLWKTPQHTIFMLLFMPLDAVLSFKILYSHNSNYIQPKCICNIKCEMDTSFFSTLEKRVQYILGHCYSENYRCIGEVNYFGDYGDIKVKLHHRFFYYLY